MDPDHRLIAYGEIEWRQAGASFEGSVTVAPGSQLVSFLARVNPQRADEATFLTRLNGVLAARVDVNGWHRFDDGPRRATHLQAHENGSEAPEITTEIVDSFPSLDPGGRLDIDTQRKMCFLASGPYLNIDLTGVDWTPPPTGGA